jgi:hypothetical protein
MLAYKFNLIIFPKMYMTTLCRSIAFKVNNARVEANIGHLSNDIISNRAFNS